MLGKVIWKGKEEKKKRFIINMNPEEHLCICHAACQKLVDSLRGIDYNKRHRKKDGNIGREHGKTDHK